MSGSIGQYINGDAFQLQSIDVHTATESSFVHISDFCRDVIIDPKGVSDEAIIVLACLMMCVNLGNGQCFSIIS